MLHRNILRPEASELFDLLCSVPELQGLTLVGGTALALQIGHRVSLDFDFAQFGGMLPGFAIDQMASRLKREGHQVQMITSPSQIAQFKINHGSNMLDLARDYTINGVKVTFFVLGRNEAQQEFYQSAAKLREPETSFDILGVEGLSCAKTLVLADRVRSRDLYDLYILMRDHDYTLEALFNSVAMLGTVDDPEHYKAIMRREIPLDRDDEGLEAVNLEGSYDQMYTYFSAEIDDYETQLACNYFLNGEQPKDR